MNRLNPYLALIACTLTCQTIAATISSFPYSESFENGFGDWINHEFEGLDWSRTSGSTPTNNTGPSKAAHGLDYAFLESSGAANANQTAYLEAVVDFSTLPHPAMLISYHLYGANSGQLSVDIYDGEWYNDVLIINEQQQLSSNENWKEVWLDLGAWSRADNVIIRIEGITGNGPTSDIAIDHIQLINGLPSIVEDYPYVFGFEYGMSNWVNIAADDFDWTINSGPTPSNTTGPDGAASGNYYAYTEASGFNNPFKAASIQAAFDFTHIPQPEFRFSYHMFGGNVGSIIVDVFDGIWHMEEFIIIGQQHDFEDQEWAHGYIDLAQFGSTDSVVIRMSAVSASGFSSDVALDRIRINNQTPVTQLPFCSSFEEIDGAWHNVSKDDFDWFRNKGTTASTETGPKGAKSGKNYLFTEASGNNHASKTAILETTIDFSESVKPEMNFGYHMHGQGMGNLTVRAFTNKWIQLGSINGRQQQEGRQLWGEMTVDLSALAGWPSVRLQLVGTTGTDHNSDMAIDDVCIREQTVITSLPDCQTFEGSLGGWNNVPGDQLNWLRQKGLTPSNGTGPIEASSGDHFLYLESSLPNHPNKSAYLEKTVDLAFASVAELTLDYHLFGAGIGSLSVWVDDGTLTEVWSIQGQQQPTQNAFWTPVVVDLSDYDGKVIKLRIVGTTTNSSKGDMAIDNLSVGGGCFYWTGNKDENWHDIANWASGAVPDFDDNTIIPDVTEASGNFPVVSSSNAKALCSDLRIEQGASVTISASNEMKIHGTLTNEGISNLGTGQLTIAGNLEQFIHGNIQIGTLEMNHLSDKGLTLFGDITIANELTLRHGIINTVDHKIALLNGEQQALRQIFNSSFINGKLERAINNNADDYFFPVGYSVSEADYHPVTLLNDHLQGTEAITAYVWPMTKSSLELDLFLTLDSAEMRYDKIANNAIWTLDPDVEPSAGTYGVRLSTLNMPGLVDDAFAPVKRSQFSQKAKDWKVHTNTYIPNKGNAGRTKASGYGERTGYTSFSHHAFAISTTSAVLPVELLRFDVVKSNEGTTAKWTTSSELNNQEFWLQVSEDGHHFQTIEVVSGAGTTSEVQHYELPVNQSFRGIQYFRLVQIDFDGSQHESSVISLNYEQTAMSLYPTKVRQGEPIFIQSGDDGITSLMVRDMLGNQLSTGLLAPVEGQKIIELNTASLSSGLYTAILHEGHATSTHSFVVIN